MVSKIETVVIGWGVLKGLAGMSVVLGAVLIAAAKSIFASKAECEGEFEKTHEKIKAEVSSLNAKLYGTRGIPIYVTHLEWEKSKAEKEKRYDRAQEYLYSKIDRLADVIEKMRQSQETTNIEISKLQPRRKGEVLS